MEMRWLPLTAQLEQYEAQAVDLLRGHGEGNAELMEVIHNHHPRFLDDEVRWLPLRISAGEIREAPFDLGDARLTVARCYSFQDWGALADLVNAIQARRPGVYEFESAAEAVISGNEQELRGLLEREPDLVRARSTRVTCYDPPVHRATLLHYIAANGVEGYRQRTPENAVTMARMLLDAGADPNALANMYGGECTTLSMLVSSSPPADKGVQVALTEVLLDFGADPNGRGTREWVSPVMTALVFGFPDAARALARRGARVDRLAVAAGLGELAEAQALLPKAEAAERHRALAIAAQLGHVEVVRILLDAGEDPDRYNPEGVHSHATPLHHAALKGHMAVVQTLVERGARLDISDKLWKSTPRGWAEHEGRREVAEFLRERAAS